jgi:hypothetical protein
MSSSLRSTPLVSKRPHEEDNNNNNNNGTTSKRRHRVTEACNPCRHRKDRCNGVRPACDNCLRAGRSCTYRPTKKRGLRTGYVRALETMAGMLFSKVQGLDLWATSLFDGQVIIPEIQLNEDELELSNISVEALAERWRGSSLMKKIEEALSAETNEDDEGNESIKVFDRKALQLSVLATETLHTRAAFDRENPNAFSAMPPGPLISSVLPTDVYASQSRFSMPSDGSAYPSTDADIAIPEPVHTETDAIVDCAMDMQEDTPLPVHWRSDLDNYFAISHCWLPISQKHDLLRTGYILSSPPTSQKTSVPVTHGDRAFLKAVLAFSAYHGESPPVQRASADNLGSVDATTVCGTIGTMIPNKIEAVEIGHVRALLIMTLVNMYSENPKQAWVSIGSATRVLTIMVKPFLRQEKPPRDLDEGTKRTALCCMALDSLVAAWVGLPPYFDDVDISSIGRLPTEGLEEWEPWIPSTAPEATTRVPASPGQILSIFNQFMDHVGLLNKMLRVSKGSLTNLHAQLTPPNLADWAGRLALPPYDELSGSPQYFNSHLLAASLKEALVSAADFGDLDTNARNTHCRLWQSIDISERFARNTGLPFVSPVCSISMFILRLTLDDKPYPQCGFEAQLGSLRSCLHELDGGNNPRNVEQHHLQQGRALTASSLRGISLMTEAERLLRNLDEIETETITQNNDFEFVQMMDSRVSAGTNAVTTADNVTRNAVGSGIDLQMMEQTVEPSAIGAALVDDNLFQSLAELDPDDW